MSAHNLPYELAQMRRAPTTKSANATLTADEVKNGPIHVDGAYAVTLPDADTCKGYEQIISADGAATVVASGGFGGAGSGSDTATLAQGEYLKVYSDGAEWYVLHNEPTS